MATVAPRGDPWTEGRRKGHRDANVAPGAAGIDELARAAGSHQAEVCRREQFRGREAVVQLDEVEILGIDACLLVGLVRGQKGERVEVGCTWQAPHRVGRQDRGEICTARRSCRVRVFSFRRHEHHRAARHGGDRT